MILSWKGLQVPNTNLLGQFVSYEENEILWIRTQTLNRKNDIYCSADARLTNIFFHCLSPRMNWRNLVSFLEMFLRSVGTYYFHACHTIL